MFFFFCLGLEETDYLDICIVGAPIKKTVEKSVIHRNY